MKGRKKFKDTKLFNFLKKVNAGEILSQVSEVVPDFGALRVVGSLIDKHPTLSGEEKIEGGILIADEQKIVKKKKLIDKGKVVVIIVAILGVFVSVSESCLNELVTTISGLF